MTGVMTSIDVHSLNSAYDQFILASDFFERSDYYRQFRDRYVNTFRWIERHLPRGGALLDIGSGQFAVLCRKLLDARCDVADIDTRYTDALRKNGIGFKAVDLSRETVPVDQPYDMAVMAEVIEHIPTPPHIVFANLKKALRPGGQLLVTTPNLYRFRNLTRMVTGRRIFDRFVLPAQDRPIGHFLEYAQEHLEWQVREAGLEIAESSLEQLSWGGSSFSARVARKLLAPLLKVHPLWRDNIVIVARRPS